MEHIGSNFMKTLFSKESKWSEGDLELLGFCPVCGSKVRSLLHSNLQDNIFFCAPGTWSMWRCDECRSGYLDPRPTVGSIGLAYGNYYTHEKQSASEGQKGIFSRFINSLRKRMRFAYLNTSYGYYLKPDLGILNFAARLLPEQLLLARANHIRQLQAPEENSRLLDIGCGNGKFLPVATELGFTAIGLEFDLSAAQAVRLAGFEVVEGALPNTGLESESFDHVTLSHVLEHLHDPVAGLREIYRLLKPGGRLWMQFPNIDAYGHEVYGSAWRGLEPPRHLVLPSCEGIKRTLLSVGLVDIELIKSENNVEHYFSESDKILAHFDHNDSRTPVVTESDRIEAVDFEKNHPEANEQLTIIGYKK